MCLCAYGIGAQGFVQVIHSLDSPICPVVPFLLWFVFFASKVCRLSDIGLAYFCWWFCGGLHKNFLNDFDPHTAPRGTMSEYTGRTLPASLCPPATPGQLSLMLGSYSFLFVVLRNGCDGWVMLAPPANSPTLPACCTSLPLQAACTHSSASSPWLPRRP